MSSRVTRGFTKNRGSANWQDTRDIRRRRGTKGFVSCWNWKKKIVLGVELEFTEIFRFGGLAWEKLPSNSPYCLLLPRNSKHFYFLCCTSSTSTFSEKASVSMVQINDQGQLVSAIFLCGYPNVPAVPPEDWPQWLFRLYKYNFPQFNNIFLSFFHWEKNSL